MNKKRIEFSRLVAEAVQEMGGHPGQIDWDTVAHCFHTRKPWSETARAIVKLQKEGK